eukprot:gnl/TRDRNA2_/TRDRNA2_171878_c1_seq2.p1 gnl/TRDRNA2_/TRDRNA2_171878_c1~~gnl/TRDRNA2_/TRDRNA2_171878_c1_seq2.p1  ORF type:complete len:366 (+),score=56.61 gnl/TRDRNA2_/TRDRNA2_171878_c1_seq2:71-1099(+)
MCAAAAEASASSAAAAAGGSPERAPVSSAPLQKSARPAEAAAPHSAPLPPAPTPRPPAAPRPQWVAKPMMPEPCRPSPRVLDAKAPADLGPRKPNATVSAPGVYTAPVVPALYYSRSSAKRQRRRSSSPRRTEQPANGVQRAASERPPGSTTGVSTNKAPNPKPARQASPQASPARQAAANAVPRSVQKKPTRAKRRDPVVAFVLSSVYRAAGKSLGSKAESTNESSEEKGGSFERCGSHGSVSEDLRLVLQEDLFRAMDSGILEQALSSLSPKDKAAVDVDYNETEAVIEDIARNLARFSVQCCFEIGHINEFEVMQDEAVSICTRAHLSIDDLIDHKFPY